MAKREGGSGRAALGIPMSALAALPVCPACYPAYAGILSALGLGALANTTAQTVLTGVLLAGALAALFYRARSRRGLGPFALGLVATLGVVASKFVLGFDGGTYAGVGVLVLASVWNVWPRAGAAPLLTLLAVAMLAGGSEATEAPAGAADLRDGLEPLSERFDAEQGRHRLLLLLSPA